MELPSNEYDKILFEMGEDTQEEGKIIDTSNKNEEPQEEKIDLLLHEIRGLKTMVSDLQEAFVLQTQEVESLKNLVKENKQITYGTYRKLEKMEKDNAGIISSVTDYALPVLSSLGFGTVPISIAGNLNKLSKFGTNMYKLYNG